MESAYGGFTQGSAKSTQQTLRKHQRRERLAARFIADSSEKCLLCHLSAQKTHPFAISVHQLLSSPNSNPRVQSPSVHFFRRLHPSDTRDRASFWLALSLFRENSSRQGFAVCQVLSPLDRQCSASKRQSILETFGRTSSVSELSTLLQGSQSFIPWQQWG